MLEIWLIRHGETEGNRMHRYIGTTDEALCEDGRKMLQKKKYPLPERLYVSPRKRCIETADILFPGMKQKIVNSLAECDFGEFENKNYKELSGNPQYQKWVDSGGIIPFPGGESREAFRKRSILGFTEIVEECIQEKIKSVALVVHGGTIMNIMEEFCNHKKSFYEWHVENGCGYEIELNIEFWKKNKRFFELNSTE